MNVSEEATSVCPRDLCKDERLDEPYVDRMSVDVRRPRPRLGARGRRRPGSRSDLASVSENWGNFGGDTGGGGERRRAPRATSRTRARTSTATATSASTTWVEKIRDEQAGAQLQARAAAARAVAVPPRRPAVPRAPPRDPIPGSRAVLQGPGPDRVAPAAPPAPGRASPTTSSARCHAPQEVGIYDESLIVVAADHGVSFDVGKRDRRTMTRQTPSRSGRSRSSSRRPGSGRGGSTPPTPSRSTSCRRSSTC